MSLVNDMLQDLEDRRAEKPGNQSSIINYTATNVSVGQDGAQRGARAALFCGLALFAMSAVVFGVRFTGQDASNVEQTNIQSLNETPQSDGKLQPSEVQPADVEIVVQPSVDTQELPQILTSTLSQPVAEVDNGKAEPELAEETVLVEETVWIEEAEVKPEWVQPTVVQKEPVEVDKAEDMLSAMAVDDAPPGKQEQIAGLLAAAEKAFARDRLSQPPEDNAWTYYEEVLYLQPQHQVALNGKEAIVQRYVTLANKQLAEGQFARALLLVGRAMTLDPENQKLWSIQKDITARSASREQSVEPLVSLPSSQTSVLQTGGDLSKSGQFEVVRSDDSLDRQRAEQARQQAQEGDLSGAVRTLETLQRKGELGVQATRALADLYLQQDNVPKAMALVDSVTILPNEQAAYIIAQGQLKQDDLAAALVTLEAYQPDINVFPEYYALLAGIYQKGGQYTSASNLYRKLSTLYPDNFAYWLGLGVALDNLNEPGAMAIYRRVQPMIPEHLVGVKSYVQKRISELALNSN